MKTELTEPIYNLWDELAALRRPQYLRDDLGNLFKSQSHCVSYVATKERNKGAGGAG